jgi:hypothetical protein
MIGLLLLLSPTAAACGDTRNPTDSPRPSSSAPVASPSLVWSTRTVPMVVADGSTRPCVELTNGGVTATTCISLPGVSSWVVGGEHFILTRGTDITLSDGSTIRTNSDGIAIGPIGNREIAEEAAAKRGCDRRELARAMAQQLGATSPAWLPTGCNSDQVAVVEFDAPSTNIALLKRQGGWVVLGIVPVDVGCASLSGALRDACRALSLPD